MSDKRNNPHSPTPVILGITLEKSWTQILFVEKNNGKAGAESYMLRFRVPQLENFCFCRFIDFPDTVKNSEAFIKKVGAAQFFCQLFQN